MPYDLTLIPLTVPLCHSGRSTHAHHGTNAQPSKRCSKPPQPDLPFVTLEGASIPTADQHLTLQALFEATQPDLPATQVKDIKTSLKYLAQALGKPDAAHCLPTDYQIPYGISKPG